MAAILKAVSTMKRSKGTEKNIILQNQKCLSRIICVGKEILTLKERHKKMIAFPEIKNKQFQFFHFVHEDDKRLLEQEEQEWFKALYFLEWELYRELGAKYYDALYEFNLTAREEKESQEEINKEIGRAHV